METVEATIVDISIDHHRRGPDEQEIDVTYEVDGVVYSRELATDTTVSFAPGIAANYSIGDKLQIFYNPQNPEIIAAPRSVSVGNVFFWIGFILFLAATASLIHMLKSRRKFLVTQEEYEKEKRDAKNAELLEKSGEKIRWQYFNTYIYGMLSFIPAIITMIITLEIRVGNLDIWQIILEMLEATPVMVAMYGIFIGPFVVLSIFNRFCFGKVVGVVNESTLFLKNREIPLNSIKEIIYHPEISSKSDPGYTHAVIVVQAKNKTEKINAVHFPIYGLRIIKKYNANIKLRFSKTIWFFVLFPTVASIVLGLLLG